MDPNQSNPAAAPLAAPTSPNPPAQSPAPEAPAPAPAPQSSIYPTPTDFTAPASAPAVESSLAPTPATEPSPAPSEPVAPVESVPAPQAAPVAEPAPINSVTQPLDASAGMPAAAPIDPVAAPTEAPTEAPVEEAPALENPFTHPITSGFPERPSAELPANNFFATAQPGSAIPQADAAAMQAQAMQDQAQAQAQMQAPAPVASAPTENKKSKLPLIIILAVVILGLGAGAFFLLPKLFGGKLEDAKVAFIREKRNEGNYALFNLKNGKQLTDFIYKDKGQFVAGYSIAKDADDKAIIVNAKAKTTVSAGKFDSITRCGSGFVGKKDSQWSLLLGDGKELATFDSNPVVKKEDKLACDDRGYFAFVSDGKVNLYSVKGELLASKEGELTRFVHNYYVSSTVEYEEDKKDDDNKKKATGTKSSVKKSYQLAADEYSSTLNLDDYEIDLDDYDLDSALDTDYDIDLNDYIDDFDEEELDYRMDDRLRSSTLGDDDDDDDEAYIDKMPGAPYLTVGGTTYILSDDGDKIDGEYEVDPEAYPDTISSDHRIVIFDKQYKTEGIGFDGKYFSDIKDRFGDCAPVIQEGKKESVLLCSSSDYKSGKYLRTNKVISDIENKVAIDADATIEAIDSKNFVSVNSDKNSVIFYVNGEKGKVLDGAHYDVQGNSGDGDAYVISKSEETKQESYGYTMTTYKPVSTTLYSATGETILSAELGDQSKSSGLGMMSNYTSFSYYADGFVTKTWMDADLSNINAEDWLDAYLGAFANFKTEVYRDGNKLDFGDITIFGKYDKSGYIVAKIDLGKYINQMIDSLKSYSSDTDNAGDSDKKSEKVDYLTYDIERIGLVDSNGNVVLSPDDYDGLALGAEGLELEASDASSLFAIGEDAASALPNISKNGAKYAVGLRRKDNKSYDIINDGKVVLNSEKIPYGTGEDYFYLKNDSGDEFYTLDGKKFYTRSE